jgi:phosphodiesterase/alkaline phosphatase D-like protein
MLVPGKKQGPICQFVTAPPMGVPAPVTFVIGGDTRQSFRLFSIMEFMRAAQPDFFVYLGDTIYADKGSTAMTLSDYWANMPKTVMGLPNDYLQRRPYL